MRGARRPPECRRPIAASRPIVRLFVCVLESVTGEQRGDARKGGNGAHGERNRERT